MSQKDEGIAAPWASSAHPYLQALTYFHIHRTKTSGFMIFWVRNNHCQWQQGQGDLARIHQLQVLHCTSAAGEKLLGRDVGRSMAPWPYLSQGK